MNRKKNKLKIYQILVLLCSLICAGVFSIGERAHAANEKAYISKENITIYTNMTKDIKIINSATKVKWSSSNKKLVSILEKRGKNDGIVTIKTGNKTGKCTIKATIGKKVYRCKVTIKNDNKISRAKLLDVVKKSETVTIKIAIVNKTNKAMKYAPDYWIEKFENGKWKKMKVDYDAEAIPVDLEYILPNSNGVTTYRISDDYKISKLKKGIYRIHISADFDKDIYNYVIFTLK